MSDKPRSVVFKDVSDVYQNNASEFQYAELRDRQSLFIVSDRFGGLSEDFLKTTLHWHDFFELEIVYGGSGTHILGSASYQMERGFACIRRPHEIHSTLQNSNDILKLYNIKFSADRLPNELRAHQIISESTICTVLDEEDLQKIGENVKRLFYEVRHKDEKYSGLMIKTLFTDILVKLMRKYHAQKNRETPIGTHVQAALQYINDHFRAEISVAELARMLHLNPHYFGTIFIKEVGKTVADYVLELRLDLAVQMLVNTELSVKDISFECGFHNSSYFVKKFGQYYGISPLKYRLSRV